MFDLTGPDVDSSDRLDRPGSNHCSKLNAAYAAKGSVMKRSFFVHFAMMTVVCAVGARPAVAQNAAEEIATQTLAATADVAPRIEKPGVFKRTFSWMGDRMSA